MTQETKTTEDLEVEDISSAPISNQHGPLKLVRDLDTGLIASIEYEFDEQGFVNWRSLIDEQYLYPKKDWFERKGLPVPDSIEGLDDSQLLIKIGGINQLARLRGYTRVKHEVENVEPNYVVDTCTIDWIPNYETDNRQVSFSWAANSTFENAGDFMLKFQETQAQNRAFNLAVRKFLNINIVSEEELDKAPEEKVFERVKDESDGKDKVQAIMAAKFKSKLEASGVKTRDQYLAFLQEHVESGKFTQEEVDLWPACKDIPIKALRILSGLVKK